MIPPAFDDSELPERLRNLLAMEVDRICTDLEWRKGFLLEIWSRHRDRGPFLDTVFSRWRTLAMSDLALVDLEAITAAEAFQRELDELRFYFQYTQDMPTTMEQRYDDAVRRIRAYGDLAIQLLGGVPTRPIVDFAAPPSPTQHLPRLTEQVAESLHAETEPGPPAAQDGQAPPDGP